MMPPNDFMLGEHAATIDMLVRGQQEMGKDIGEIKDILSARDGERGALRWIATTGAGVVGATLAMLVHWFNAKYTT